MSVSVQNLTKKFSTQTAVDNLTFEASPGEILGFLGPNGAGKSTTMKIISCYLGADSGSTIVAGHDVEKHPLEVRASLGYLPEHNPLYKDMFVREYLGFVARIHGIPKAGQRIEEMIEVTGLGHEAGKKIGALSKGYRQRVGLAQAMIHNPEVLVLDEPTSGLDPNQLAEIRQLIKQLGREKTVIFSTHIMQEVQALCDRVVIIDKGKMVADEKINDLSGLLNDETVVEVEFLNDISESTFKSISGLSKLTKVAKNTWQFFFDNHADLRKEIFKTAVQNDVVIIGMKKRDNTLEDIFQSLTKDA